MTTATLESRTLFGHPRGLAYIVFAEGWERFSFYGMQALLVLYMVSHLLQPGTIETVAGFAGFRNVLEAVFGPLSVQALASQIFGLYIGLVYLFPVLGGLLGDRYLGRTRAVVIGAALMAVGHFLMAFEAAFLFALLSLIAGSGLLKGNLAAQVGNLYPKDDSRRDSAFSIYCLAINTGAFVAPLVCGTLGEFYGWHYGFGVAGIGMLVGIVIYLAGRSYLPPDTLAAAAERPKLQPGEGPSVAALACVIAITSLYWAAQTQVWNVYPLWLRDRVDRDLLGLTVPVTWFQSLDTLAVLALAPVVIWIWRRQARRQAEPRELAKIAIGCLAFMGACFLLALGETAADTAKVSLLWPTVFHFCCAVGYLYVWPVTLSLVSRAAPAAVNGMMVGAYYLAIFAGGIFSGWLARFYEMLTPAQFWLMHGLVVGCGAALIVVLSRPLTGILFTNKPAVLAMPARAV
ncbi:peptide MFS transporter [Steroidobacter sp.]|uniref:peptide MFS transporter n=1 Tax=Steroidobacter sp. TaxID=1978227 RepID=UPI001A5010B9|nr:peptide MFS transporter [Steroidobacter sp.]MBL8265830.1 peptide MFS transporter [Steroidobacter sp.]